MNQPRNNFNNNVVEIDLVDFFKRALKSWKKGLLMAVICALLGAGIAQIRFMWVETHQEKFEEKKYLKAREKLTEKELDEAERVFQQYSTYFRVQEAQDKHIGDAILMTLDPEKAIMKNKRYIVTSGQSGLVTSLKNMLRNPDVYRRLAGVVGGDATEQDMEELVNVDISTWQNWQEIVIRGAENVQQETTKQAAGEGAIPETMNTTLVNLTVLGVDDAFCEQISTEMEKILSEAVEGIAAMDPDTTWAPFGEDPVLDSEEQILDRQRELLESVTQIVTIRKKFADETVSKLNKKQKTYFEQLQLRDDAREPEQKESRGLIRFSAIGFLLGIFLFFMTILLPYVLGGKIRTAEEWEQTAGVRMIRRLDGAGSGADADMVSNELGAWKDGKKFFLATGAGSQTSDFAADSAFSKGLLDRSKEYKLSIGDPLSDADALAAMLASDGILLGVVVDHTDREGLARICRIAVDHSVPILGYLAAGGAANE